MAVRVCVCLGLLFGMLLSWRLWLTGGRGFPLLPCFGLGHLPAPFDWLLFLAALCLGALVAVRAWDHWLVVALVATLVLLAVLDQMRWQPWAYQYLLCLVPLAFVAGREDRAGAEAALDLVRLVVVAIYFWSGIHKFGVQFQRTYEADVVGRALGSLSGFLRDLILWGGNLVPWIEILIGLLLIVPRARRVGIALALGTHGFILLMLGPFGTASNSVIWPWNLAMAALVVSLFWGFDGWAFRNLLVAKRLRVPALAIGVLVLAMPAFSYSKRWPQYLSFHLYSGHHQRMALFIENGSAARADEYFRGFMKPASETPGGPPSHQRLSFAQWAMGELNVPMPSEERLLLGVAKHLVGALDLSADDFFYRDFPKLLAERGWDRYSPVEVKGMSRFREFRFGKENK